MNAAEKLKQKDQILMSKKELRVLLGGVSDMTIWRYLRDKRIPAPIRLKGMHPRWRRDEVLESLGLHN